MIVLQRQRIDWLDFTRFLCAFMILGIHWLRACFKTGLFGVGEKNVLVDGYQGQTIGLGMLPHVLIAGSAPTLPVWLSNLVGLLGGFGWEAVSALIIVSGFSLSLSLGTKSLDLAQWLDWLAKRAKRILVPFYLIALPFLAAYFLLLLVVPKFHGSFAHGIDKKLHELFHTPLLGVLMSHIALFDPFQRQGIASFFAPAWWFVPAILVAYASYPFLIWIARRNEMALFFGSAALSIATYALVERNILIDESWYYIVLQESFNFSLGILAGKAWLTTSRREAIERVLRPWYAFPVGLAMFALGNVANWSSSTRPIASIFFGPGLLLMLVAISMYAQKSALAHVARKIDSYDIYLVHQPFAFPIALAGRFLFNEYAIFVGMFAFYAIAILAAMLLGNVRRRLERRTVHPTRGAVPIIRA